MAKIRESGERFPRIPGSLMRGSSPRRRPARPRRASRGCAAPRRVGAPISQSSAGALVAGEGQQRRAITERGRQLGRLTRVRHAPGRGRTRAPVPRRRRAGARRPTRRDRVSTSYSVWSGHCSVSLATVNANAGSCAAAVTNRWNRVASSSFSRHLMTRSDGSCPSAPSIGRITPGSHTNAHEARVARRGLQRERGAVGHAEQRDPREVVGPLRARLHGVDHGRDDGGPVVGGADAVDDAGRSPDRDRRMRPRSTRARRRRARRSSACRTTARRARAARRAAGGSRRGRESGTRGTGPVPTARRTARSPAAARTTRRGSGGDRATRTASATDRSSRARTRTRHIGSWRRAGRRAPRCRDAPAASLSTAIASTRAPSAVSASNHASLSPTGTSPVAANTSSGSAIP